MPKVKYSPAREKFAEDRAVSKLIPICTEIIADLDTPLTLFAKIADEGDHVFLFESMEGGEKWGRYSFIGYDPLVTFSSLGDRVTVAEARTGLENSTTFTSDPLVALKDMIEGFNAAEYDFLPKFCGGAVGSLGYDMVRFMENLPDHRAASDLPDSAFMIPRIVLVHDSFKQTVTVVCWVQTDNDDTSETLYEQAIEGISHVIEKIKKPVDSKLFEEGGKGLDTPHTFTSNMDKAQFGEMVETAKEYIRAGDIIQVVLSQRFHTTTELSPLVLYRALRHINPSPYLFYLQHGDLVQIGSSPEILVRKEGRNIELRPIAGTRKRGRTAEEDLALEKELLADPKERAEHMMLVDLGRNDVGRVAKGGYVRVEDLLVIERYSHVMHIVSGVHGVIDDGKDQFDVMSACFPAGTVSGAPKIRAMEIIDELEPEKRGAYAGSVGYFGFSGNMDFCITIRTFVMKGKDLWIQAGAGIVADSDPVSEFEETVNKSLGLRRAVELAEKGF
ncbi:anthranilate synthase component I [Desulforhopalus sp. IMCC35007]|uniref:anthranilate synthase component I n=1 Tax=Desulforhopalus sp. IMCC35007 TaxID=2569543 RepID=UPI0010AE638E|nr:anthranilate synthase component I [Desulforhopalus sp. IMCC35007]TKB10226.1 anthranilate synthase component I [Desulforhopalus sp. IMCC35007]